VARSKQGDFSDPVVQNIVRQLKKAGCTDAYLASAMHGMYYQATSLEDFRRFLVQRLSLILGASAKMRNR